MARRDEREYGVYSTEEQSAFAKASARPGQSPKGDGRRRQPGCRARRMQADFHHGLLMTGAAALAE
jgi:hypothetical protein